MAAPVPSAPRLLKAPLHFPVGSWSTLGRQEEVFTDGSSSLGLKEENLGTGLFLASLDDMAGPDYYYDYLLISLFVFFSFLFL